MEEGKLETKPDIKKVTLSDGIERDYIDTYEKLYWIVDERFKEQKEKNPNVEPIINLARLIICIIDNLRRPFSFWIGKLCGKIEGIINLGRASDLIPNKQNKIIVKDEIQFEVKYKISFANSIIYSMQFWNTKFLKEVIFHGTQFLGFTYIEDSIFFENVRFEKNDINKNIENDYMLPVNMSKIKFVNNTFKKTVTFYNENWEDAGNICFMGNVYEGDVNFGRCSLLDDKNYYDFSSSIFKGSVIVSCDPQIPSNERLYRNDYLNNYIPFSHINFYGAHFHKKLKINNVAIGEISLQNCHFEDTVNISNNKYNTSSSLDFSFSTINSLLFIDSDLGNDKGEPIRLEKEICFSKSLITKDALIFLRNINNGNDAKKQGCLNFEYANILGTITIQDSKLKEIKLAKSTLIGNINIEDVDTGYDCRESIAKIKDSFLKRNDVVNSLVYKAKEMESYSNDLSKCFSCKFLKIESVN